MIQTADTYTNRLLIFQVYFYTAFKMHFLNKCNLMTYNVWKVTLFHMEGDNVMNLVACMQSQLIYQPNKGRLLIYMIAQTAHQISLCENLLRGQIYKTFG